MGRIDTTKDFSKVTGSLVKAQKLVRSLLDENEWFECNTGKRGNKVVYSNGKQNKFNWSYEPESKILTVTYTDGRPAPQEVEKPEYYVVWIEGIEPKNGEKIEKILPKHTYTTSMAKAMRVLPEHREIVRDILRSKGIAKWALENCFVRTSYAPKGTLFKPL